MNIRSPVFKVKYFETWEMSWSTENNICLVSNFFSLESLKKEINNIDFYLDINGKKVQEGNTQQMLFSVDQLISHVSKYFTLKTGDLIFTGTPAGVGPVQREDLLELYLEGKRIFYFNVK